MTDAELQAIRERYYAAAIETHTPSGTVEHVSLAGSDKTIKESLADIPALLEEVAKLREVVEAIKGSHNFPHALQLAHTILTAPAGEQP